MQDVYLSRAMDGQDDTEQAETRPNDAFSGEGNGAADPPKARTLGPLKMVFTAAAQYPAQIGLALVALLITAGATLAIPWRFKVIIDEAFGGTAGPQEIGHAFQYLLMIVLVLGIGTALRF
ncbi:MAG TPA: hypothetical protein VK839_04670, partial [Erythrobacter sp.]|nr:hypothetical protein [Erythrobacter sp.]